MVEMVKRLKGRVWDLWLFATKSIIREQKSILTGNMSRAEADFSPL